ncbi:MAG: Chk1 protein kinase [Alyxoria varia]|nr:MAG: Chk1 protein kinase [Alyxoria varia]
MGLSTQVGQQPLPADLPFRIISRTIGQGAYAFIRKACPHTASTPVIAVKFIHKEHAYKQGRVKPKQIQAEIALHSHVGKHRNIIEFMATGEDERWTWIAMELASGDLFDKIEADMGIGEDVAHFYFSQLVSAVSYVHSRSVAHRDIKPENILLSDGDLKLADFGLAVLFAHNGQTKPCQTVCGSPPYMAPEVVPKDGFTGKKTDPYDGDVADIWSCGIVLFVLLVGNTPWDEPTQSSPEFINYTENGSTDELWERIPHQARSLLRGILKVDAKSRMSLEDVRRHPWYTRPNPFMSRDGRKTNPVGLAARMLENLHIDFGADPMVNTSASQRQNLERSPRQSRRKAADADATHIDDGSTRLAFTQPDPALAETQIDWERPQAQVISNDGVSASQPNALTTNTTSPLRGRRHPTSILSQAALTALSQDPCLSQFSMTGPSVPLSLTQQAQRFRDILPEHSLARFLSFMDFPLLLPLLCEALGRLGIPAPAPKHITASVDTGSAGEAYVIGNSKAFIPVKTRDQRNCSLFGSICVERIEEEVLEVRFLKRKGDPVEWRRLFKKIAVLCKDAILRPED